MPSPRPPSSAPASIGKKRKRPASEDDPDYIFFLERLRHDPHGTGYFLDLDDVSLRYENTSDDSPPPPPPPPAAADVDDGDMTNSDNENWVDGAALSAIVDDPHAAASIDQDYLQFLHRAAALCPKNSNIVSSSKRRKQSSHLHSTNPPPPPKLIPSPRSPLSHRRGTRASSSSFSINLTKCINRPFDPREYKQLMELASERKPLLKYKHLRTDSVPYETGQTGRSYFDHHPELCTKVTRADRVGGLKLLRGFKFWLMHAGDEGAYFPWMSTASNRRTELACRHALLPKSTPRPIS